MPALGGSATFNGLTITWPSTLADIPDQTSGGTGATATVAAQQQVIKALNSEWMASCLNLIADSFDMSFEDSGATVRTINLEFENKSGSNNLAYVTSSLSGISRDNMTTDGLTLTFNMHYYSSLNDADVNGKDTAVSGGGYLDRTLAHELTHAVMSANIKNFGDLPKYIKEGMAELVHGVDDTRRSGILELADPANSSEFRKMLEGEVDDIDGVTASSAYGGGFMLLRYMAKQSAGGNGALTTSSDGDYYSFNYKLTDKAFTFQVGTQANQSIRMGFADMRAKSLGLENAKQERVSVTTRENAVNALGTLDYALAKALDQQTTIGAMQSRMEHTINTLTIALENVQKSESTIRDADMAKEMTEFTKHNLLTQMAQSMLAQANQNSSSVLSLLQ
ncbi:MAG: hypothetical protein IJU00_12185 [Selenomonas sp.]|nr:hypothetical protein [Selenomonas sp.]